MLWNKPRKDSCICIVFQQILVKPTRTWALIHSPSVTWSLLPLVNLFNVILKLLNGTVSTESKPDAFVGDGATVMLWVGPPLQDIFS